MYCSFCHNEILTILYKCPNHEQVIACRGCHEYDCYICKSEFMKNKIQCCVSCHKHQNTKYMFGSQYNSFCYDCVLQRYRKSSGKKVVLINHIFEVEKYQVYCYLKDFCFQCHKSLRNQRNQQLQSGLKQIYPLEVNVCYKCSSKNIPSNIKTQVTSSRLNHFTTHHQPIISNQYPSYNHSYSPQTPTFVDSTKFNYYRQSKNKSTASSLSLQQKWKQKLNTNILRCMSCNFMILNHADNIMTQDLLICGYCANRSNLKENQFSQLVDDQKKQWEKSLIKEQQKIYESIAKSQLNKKDPCKITYIKNVQKQKLQPVYNYKKQNKQTITEEKTNNKLNQNNLVIKKPNQNNLPAKKQDFLQILQKVPLQLDDFKNCELIQCQNCKMQLQPQAVIWQQNTNRALCRCCFNQIVDQIKNSLSYYHRNHQINIKQTTISQQTEFKTSNKQRISTNKNRQQRSSQGVNIKQKNLQNQPIIIQQELLRPINQVKRTQSWNDQIIVEPVQDHQKRKRQKFIKENKIIEQQETKQNQIPQSRENPHKPQIIEPQITQNKQQSTNYKSSRVQQNWDDIIFLQPILGQQKTNKNKIYNQEQNQPIIFEEQQLPSKKLKKIESWNQEILLEPIDSEPKKMQKNNVQKDENRTKQMQLQKRRQKQLKQAQQKTTYIKNPPYTTSTTTNQNTNLRSQTPKQQQSSYQTTSLKNNQKKSNNYQQNKQHKNNQKYTQLNKNNHANQSKYQRQYQQMRQKFQRQSKNLITSKKQASQRPFKDIQQSRQQANQRYMRHQQMPNGYPQTQSRYYPSNPNPHTYNQNLYQNRNTDQYPQYNYIHPSFQHNPHYQNRNHPPNYGYNSNSNYYNYSNYRDYGYQNERLLTNSRKRYENQINHNRTQKLDQRICSICMIVYSSYANNCYIGQKNVCQPCYTNFIRQRRY